METKSNITTNTIIGIIVILVGGLFLGRNFDLFPGEYVWQIFRWQSILIIIGIITYLSSGSKPLGAVIAAIGILGFVPNFWALILIGLGAYIIYKNQTKQTSGNIYESGESGVENEYINDVSIFGGSKKNFQFENFKGGNITSIFGGSEINLTESNLSDGISTLNLFFLFGGSNLRIPRNWKVFVEFTPILGGFKDNRVIIADEVSSNKKLVLKGFILFGGGELKN